MILLYYADGSPAAEFAATGAGLTAALAAAASGDVLWLPANAGISGDVTVPAGVTVMGLSRGRSILTGKITLAAGANLCNLSVLRTANDGNDLIGVESAAESYIYACNISCIQSGAGNAMAVRATTGGDIDIFDSWLTGTSVGGAGYSAFAFSGCIHWYGGRATYSTAATA